jgi:hypothetical protein
MRSVEDIPDISYYVPSMPNGQSHHVISRGQKPIFYRPEELKDKGEGKTVWVDAFEKIVCGIYWALEAPVPYAFRTPNGMIRSLDAGCIKMLLNRAKPELDLLVDGYGYIDAVVPSEALTNRYEPIKCRLIEQVQRAGGT